MLVVCLSMAGGCEMTMNQAVQDRNERVGGFLDEHITKSRIPGIQYMIMDPDQVIFQYAGGWADIKNKMPIPESTWTHWTKNFSSRRIDEMRAGK